MRAPLFALTLVLSAACQSPTSPTTEAAVTRTVTRETFEERVQNPCTGEGALFTIGVVITTQVSGTIERFGAIESITGVGDLGTTFTGQFHLNSVSHLAGGTAAQFTELVHGSDGSGFSFVGVFTVDRTGESKLELNEFRCL
jgi:hypothetical protein